MLPWTRKAPQAFRPSRIALCTLRFYVSCANSRFRIGKHHVMLQGVALLLALLPQHPPVATSAAVVCPQDASGAVQTSYRSVIFGSRFTLHRHQRIIAFRSRLRRRQGSSRYLVEKAKWNCEGPRLPGVCSSMSSRLLCVWP